MSNRAKTKSKPERFDEWEGAKHNSHKKHRKCELRGKLKDLVMLDEANFEDQIPRE